MTDEEKTFFEQMLKQVNDKMGELLDAITLVRDDATNIKGHVVYVMEDSLTLGRRISRLEDEMRQRRGEGGS